MDTGNLSGGNLVFNEAKTNSFRNSHNGFERCQAKPIDRFIQADRERITDPVVARSYDRPLGTAGSKIAVKVGLITVRMHQISARFPNEVSYFVHDRIIETAITMKCFD